MCLLAGSYFGYVSGVIGGLGSSIVKCRFFNESVSGEGANESSGVGLLSDPNAGDETSAKQSAMLGLLTACLLVGGILGALVGTPLADRRGRRPCYILCGLLGVSSALLGVVDDFGALVGLRTLAGVPVGILAGLVPTYVTEVCPARIRGSTGTLFQVAICLSILVAEALNLAFAPDYDPDGDVAHRCVETWKWKAQLSFSALPALGMLLHAAVGFPESRDWQRREGLLSGDTDSVIGSVLGDDDLARLTDPLAGTPAPAPPPRAREPDDYGWADLLLTWEGLRWAGVGVGLAASAQLTGINAIIYYAPEIFRDAHFSNVLVYTVVFVGGWNFLSVFAAVALVDRVGRRPLMLVALAGMTASSALLGAAYSWVNGSSKSGLTLAGLVGFIFFFEVGPGALFFLLASELFPKHIRSKGLILTNVANWVFNITISFSFPIIQNSLGSGTTFFILAIVGLLCTLFGLYKLPETSDT